MMNEIEIIKSVIEYSIDNSPEEHDLFLLLGLNSNSFYKEIYIDRKKSENKIREAIFYPGKMSIISGEKGCGKTSISNKVLNSLDKKNFKIYANFKDENIFDKKLKSLKRKTENKSDRNELSFHIFDKFVLNQIKRTLSESGISDNRIGEYIFLNGLPQSKSNPKYRELQSYLEFTEFNNVKDANYKIRLATLQKCLKEEVRLRVIWLNYIKKFTIKEYSTYLIKNTIYERFVCLFDNVDSIDSLTDQANFIHYCQKFQSEFKEHFNLIITIRTINPTWQTIYTDYDSFCQDNILLDYFEFIDENFFRDHQIFRKKDFSAKERFEILEILSTKHQELSFKIIDKRIKLIKKHVLSLKTKYTINSKKINFILDACKLILVNERIRNSLTNLCNGDRRTTLKKLIEFIEFLDSKNLLPLNGNFALESVFNNWLIEKSSIFSIDPLDFVHSFRITDDKGILLNHLILNLISNLTDTQSIFYQYEKSLNVKLILDELYKIGFSIKRSRKALFNLLIKEKIPTGLIECANYGKILSENIVLDTEVVWLTPRARTLKGYTIFTFNFLLALLIQNRYSKDNIVITHEIDSTSPEAFNFILSFLSKLGERHVKTMSIIFKNMSSNNHEWSMRTIGKKYIDNFGLNIGEDQTKNNYLFDNIIISHISYIKGLKIIDHEKRNILSKYYRLKKLFRSDIELLLSNQSLSGINYLESISLRNLS